MDSLGREFWTQLFSYFSKRKLLLAALNFPIPQLDYHLIPFGFWFSSSTHDYILAGDLRCCQVP